jgi:prefoldin subunit 5
MKRSRVNLFAGALCVGLLCGCGQKVDENKPIETVKTEATQMNQAALQKQVDAYSKAIEMKKQELEKLVQQIKEIPATELLGDKAKELKAQQGKLTSSISNLTERMNVYIAQLNVAAKAK